MLRLTEELRRMLAEPQGKLYEGLGLEPLERALADHGHELLVCVGDIVSYYSLKVTRPDIVVIDGRSVRKSLGDGILDELKGRTRDYVNVNAKNPPGHITEDLVEKLSHAVDLAISGYKVRVFVDGEEDLAVIPLVLMLPKGSLIVYGQPGRGVVAVEVDAVRRREMLEIVNKMEKSGKTFEKLRGWYYGRFG